MDTLVKHNVVIITVQQIRMEIFSFSEYNFIQAICYGLL